MIAGATTQACGTAPARVLVPADVAAPALLLGAEVQVLGGQTMGTTWQVRCAAPRGMAMGRVASGIERVLDRVIAQMSTWDPLSELCRWGRLPPGTWQRLSPDFAAVMRDALSVAQASRGAYDPTAAPLVDLWGFGPHGRWHEASFEVPADEVLAAARLGWQALRMDDQDRLWQPGGWRLDLSAIAKGHAVDAVSAYLGACGLHHHLVEIGGELRGEGHRPDGWPWWVGVESPHPACTLAPLRVALHGLSVATSGDYRRSFDHRGQRHAHTIDPRSRRPVTHAVASVTVLHRRCCLADAWSTALWVLGVDEGLQLARQHGLAAWWIERPCAAPSAPACERGWRETWSPAARALLEA